jgi:hypothetical protein
MLMSRCAFSIALAASAVRMSRATNTCPPVTRRYMVARRSVTSRACPATTLVNRSDGVPPVPRIDPLGRITDEEVDPAAEP